MPIPTSGTKSPEEKILFFFKSGNLVDGEDLFQKTFSGEKKPPETLVLGIFAELEKQNAFQESFDFIRRGSEWFPGNPEITKACEDATLHLAQITFEKGEKQIHDIRQKSEEYTRSTAGGGLGQERLRAENEKALRELTENAMATFKRGLELKPDDLFGLVGVQHCLVMLQRNEEAAELGQRITEVQTAQLPRLGLYGVGEGLSEQQETDEEKAEKAAEKAAAEPPPIIPFEEPPPPKPSSEGIQVPLPARPSMEKLKALFDAGELEEAQTGLETLLADDARNVPALLLIARCCFALKEFRAAEKYLRRVIFQDPESLEAHELQTELQEHELKILRRASAEYVKKGIQVGPYLGKHFFEKAKLCLEQSRILLPEDPILLDQHYTTLMFLGQAAEAKALLARIRLLSPRYKTLWERENNQSLCFIAGWAYALQPSAIEDFRRFRRERLLPNAPGRHLVRCYVRLSPHLVDLVRRLRVPPFFGRIALEPLRWMISS